MTAWHTYFKQLAQALLEHCRKHPGNPGKELFKLAKSDKILLQHNTWLLDHEARSGGAEIDPLHVFASFNLFNTPRNRQSQLLGYWLKIFSIPFKDTKIDYSGHPAIFEKSILLERKPADQAQVWEIFTAVMEKGQAALTKDNFTKISKWYAVGLHPFTVFLYYINPFNFMPLDKNTLNLLMKAELAQSRTILYEDYMRLIRFKDSEKYLEISKKAYDLFYDSKALVKYGKELHELYKRPGEHRHRTTDSDFRLIGIRVLKATEKKFSKVLEYGKPYFFYSRFSRNKDGTVTAGELEDTVLYSRPGLNINISAVVGKNGSGKSTITELLYLSIYNISCRYKSENRIMKPVNGIHVELYYLGNTLYRLEIKGGQVKVYSYHKTGNSYNRPVLMKANEFNLSHFFYTLALNYSHYGLNENITGDWVTNLFTRNDDYRVPLTIIPRRKGGNIDINEENRLVISRLLAILLEYTTKGDDDFRKLTDEGNEKGRKARQIRFTNDSASKFEIYHSKHNWYRLNRNSVLKELYRHYKIKKTGIPVKTRRMVEDYIYQVLLTMPGRYFLYQRMLAGTRTRPKVGSPKKYFEIIDRDHSHATTRFRQAVNFLKYKELYTIPANRFIDIHQLSLRINRLMKKLQAEANKIIEFIPASFYHAELKLDDGSHFNDLSSGEKQRIYVINSLKYHLANLNSVTNEGLLNYSSVNIIFDEIELYFHPDLQRKFISFLLENLSTNLFPNIFEINFCFITHSPFILSDIPSENILFLKKDDMKKEKNTGLMTFGANIHELLMNGFFMENTLGAFALKQVKEIIDFYNKVINTGAGKKKEELRIKYDEFKKRFRYIAENLGEGYIRNLLKNHISEIEERLGDKSFIEAQVKKLREEMKRLESKMNKDA